MNWQLLAIALGTLVSEDLACIGAGLLVAQGELSFAAATAACFTGIFTGDFLLVLAGRWLGHPLVRRWIAPERFAQASAWLQRKGWIVILFSRFTPGLRLPVFVAAGISRAPLIPIATALFLAAAVWTPLLVALPAWLGQTASKMFAGPGLAAAVLVTILISRLLLRIPRDGRILWGKVQRIWRWEFWPAWLAYLPVVPYFFYLAIRHRSLTLFTASNPGILGGGLMGESKSGILARLDPVRLPQYLVLPAALDKSSRKALARQFSTTAGFPLAAKPEVGERGREVAILRGAAQLEAHLEAAGGDLILQEYLAGEEFGIYYHRDPNQPSGRILSINAKAFPSVTGDGSSSVRELILRDSRAICLAETYLAGLGPAKSNQVLGLGEQLQLVEIGSHCRGAIFLDATHLVTPKLDAAVDELSQSHEGFYLGRYDVRAESREALQRGEFRVIELNGVGGEAAHIYDPAVSIFAAYASLMRTLRLAFETGAANRERGFEPLSVLPFLRLLHGHFRRGSAGPGNQAADEGKFPPMKQQNQGRPHEHHQGQREQLSLVAHGLQLDPQFGQMSSNRPRNYAQGE
jgi:membrane protein DedA with SNARE-associated domain